MPEYQKASQEYTAMLQQVKEKAGGEFLDQLENRIITYWSLQSYLSFNNYYL